MDRQRLQEVHQTEPTQSRINEDFLEWLKTKGPTWLLMILVVVAAYMGWDRWTQYKDNYRIEAWRALAECTLPSAFEDVAAQYENILGLPQLAKNAAADALLRQIMIGRPLGTDPPPADPPQELSDEWREEYLRRADRLYGEVLETDDSTLAMTLHMVSAMTGRAVTAESRGSRSEALRWYEQAAKRAEGFYPELTERARRRASAVDRFSEAVTLPNQQDLPTGAQPPTLQPADIEDVLKDLLEPDQTSAG
ncbi:MAG: hypothetical protein IH888_05980 [Planctomycetes bacterium]|nr:hypothetical protein [Planctomycetota bacterium]